MSYYRSGLLRVLTSSSLLHPTRLSMICANPPGIVIPDKAAGLETCSNMHIRKRRTETRQNKFRMYKEPNRKAVFPPNRLPARVLLPFLTGGPLLYTTFALLLQTVAMSARNLADPLI